jgi:putative transposase
MPWKETNVLEERMKFVSRYLQGEKIAVLCNEFGISRKTGHKIINRYHAEGVQGLSDKSSVAVRNRKSTPLEVQKCILELKGEFPSWGAPKIAELLKRRHPEIKAPVVSTIHAILDKNGLVKNRSARRRYKAQGTNLRATTAPNDLWCIDYKGEFLLGNKQYCYPLTISDHFSRYLLKCEAVSGTKTKEAHPVFEGAFREYGMPLAIRSDNGVPFSSVRALFGLSRLSVWWLRLGIKIERTEPGCPQQNGRHERIHKTLKMEALGTRRANFLQQQEVLDEFVEQYNRVRPHAALGMKTPAELYRHSPREFPRFLTEPGYQNADKIVTVSHCGTMPIGRQRKVFLSESFGNQPVGLYAQDDGVWLVKFMDYELGFFDDESLRFTPTENPFINSP